LKRGVWSNTISFSSPEADFTSAVHTNREDQTQIESSENNWSGHLSFSSPEADFTAASVSRSDSEELVENEWSGILSFSSPESDFTAVSAGRSDEELVETSQTEFINHVQNSQYHRNTMAYSLSFASAENDFYSQNVQNLLNDRMKMQLENVSKTYSQGKSTKRTSSQNEIESNTILQNKFVHDAPLPTTYESATSLFLDPRAIVVTEPTAPFRIVSVNAAWERLCGFKQSECYGKTLKCIQGPETSSDAITALMSQALKGEEAGTVLTNYTKSGQKFRNRLKVGPLKSDNEIVTHFVGVLADISDNGDYASDGGRKMNI